MKLSLASKKDMDALMKIEISALRHLSGVHPAFPKHEGSGIVDGYRYAVMELLGQSLADIQESMPSGKLSISSTVRVGIQLLDVNEHLL